MYATEPPTEAAPADIHHKLGQLTRQLHDTLRELGVADGLRHAALGIPDAKNRLTYIARLTGEAADKVLGRVEQAKQAQNHLLEQTRQLRLDLQDASPATDPARVLDYLAQVDACGAQIHEQLTEIMMAQDFHDLTGQVIARVVQMASVLEDQLVQLTLQTAPGLSAPSTTPAAPGPEGHTLAGPVINPATQTDVMTDQSQVDDLLASLGF